MTEKAEAAEPDTKDRHVDTSSSGSVRRSPPILGLVIVSALNVASLGFITYHFASHAEEPAAERLKPPKGEDGSGTKGGSPAPGVMVTTAGIRGNVDLVPAPDLILEIASGRERAAAEKHAESGDTAKPGGTAVFRNGKKRSVDDADTDDADIAAEPPSDGERRAEKKQEQVKAEPASWVQLGALSEQATAERFWAELQARHPELLKNRRPRYVGPDDVGGKLHHLRVGPMSIDDAAALCKKLEARGADCFCLKAEAGARS